MRSLTLEGNKETCWSILCRQKLLCLNVATLSTQLYFFFQRENVIGVKSFLDKMELSDVVIKSGVNFTETTAVQHIEIIPAVCKGPGF